MDAWHPGVDVYWQDNAWADTTFSVDWVNRTLASAVEGTDHFVLFVDNLTAQQTDAFKTPVANHHGLANATDLWQVIDAGIAQALKVLTGHEYQRWLDREENADLWYGHGETLSAVGWKFMRKAVWSRARTFAMEMLAEDRLSNDSRWYRGSTYHSRRSSWV